MTADEFAAPFRVAQRMRGHPDRRAARLIECLKAVGDVGSAAVAALPLVAKLLVHPGGCDVPRHVEFWDWTMADDCQVVHPACRATVADEAVRTLGRIGPAALPSLEEVCRTGPPGLRLAALRCLGSAGMAAVAGRGAALARLELARYDCVARPAAAAVLCRCVVTDDATADAALALVGDADPDVAVAALTLTYNGWPGLVSGGQQREAGPRFRAALVARFGDPDPRIPPTAVAALMNPNIASRDVEPDVRRLMRHRDPSVRQQARNVLGTNDHLGLPPTAAEEE